jgi:hypothetical protein
MKKITLFLAFMVFGISASFAQIKEAPTAMSKGTNNAFSLELRTTVQKDVEKSWEKYIKGFKGKVKKDKKSGQILADNSTMENLSSNTVDVYSTVRSSGENTILTVWYDLGGAYLNSAMHGDKIAAVEKMLNDFALSVSIASVEEDLKEQQKVLKDLDKDQKGLVKDKESKESDIAKFEQKILEAKEAIKQNLEAQKNKQIAIETQKKVVSDIETILKKLK